MLTLLQISCTRQKMGKVFEQFFLELYWQRFFTKGVKYKRLHFGIHEYRY